MKQFSISVSHWFTTSKVGRDFSYNKLCIRIAPQLTFSKLGNTRESQSWLEAEPSAQSLPRYNIQATTAKHCGETDIKAPSSFPILLDFPNLRSSRPELFCKKGVLKHFAKFTGKHLCQSLFFNKVAGLAVGRCFPVSFAQFLRTPFLQNTSGRLLLKIRIISIFSLLTTLE